MKLWIRQLRDSWRHSPQDNHIPILGLPHYMVWEERINVRLGGERDFLYMNASVLILTLNSKDHISR